MRQIASIVEGQGDVAAVPVLIRRILEAVGATDTAQVLKPVRVQKNTLLKSGELERYARLVTDKARGEAVVFVVVDADSDCAARRGPELQARLNRVAPGSAVLAVREYENWLIADAAALAQNSAFQDRINRPGDPEAVPDAKRWLSDRRTDGRSYRPTLDQARLTELVDLEVVRQRCPSFDKFWREVERLATS